MRFASLLFIGVAAAIAGVYYSKNRSLALPLQQQGDAEKFSKIENFTDAQIDDRLDDSFPASDPPSWGPRELLH